MNHLTFIPQSEFARVEGGTRPWPDTLRLLADMSRLNAISAVKRAGSGHLGSSLSAMDIVVWLYCRRLNVRRVGWASPERDIYFSSKGHDVPGLYAVLFSLGVLSLDQLLKLRRFGGLDGHPDIRVPGIEANSGSLGMGISKGRGMAWAKRSRGLGGRVFVLTGDGEFQEGQNFEALQASVQQKIGNLVVIMDHNKVQTDLPVGQILDLGDLEQKLRAFGWWVGRCDGHDVEALDRLLDESEAAGDRPKFVIADTIKGRGVSFMEHPAALKKGGGLYPWHAGAPADDVYEQAVDEIMERLRRAVGDPPLDTIRIDPRDGSVLKDGGASLEGEQLSVRPMKSTSEYLADAYGEALVELGAAHPELVVLDADLAADCRVRKFAQAYPDRFIENGIAEQDMVSMAGGLARMGLLPVVNSFASFLASRANEQIYTNAGEGTKIVYALHYAGLIPAGPGKSHQSLRDISLLGALPNCVIVQPCCAEETRRAVRYCVEEAKENCAIRLPIGPSPRRIEMPPDAKFVPGRGTLLRGGDHALLVAYGPVLLHEALLASEALAAEGVGLAVLNMPWLNRFDMDWLAAAVRPYRRVFVVEDHAPVGGLADRMSAALMDAGLLRDRSVVRFAVDGYPACGTPPEALQHHGLDGASIARRVRERL